MEGAKDRALEESRASAARGPAVVLQGPVLRNNRLEQVLVNHSCSDRVLESWVCSSHHCTRHTRAARPQAPAQPDGTHLLRAAPVLADGFPWPQRIPSSS